MSSINIHTQNNLFSAISTHPHSRKIVVPTCHRWEINPYKHCEVGHDICKNIRESTHFCVFWSSNWWLIFFLNYWSFFWIGTPQIIYKAGGRKQEPESSLCFRISTSENTIVLWIRWLFLQKNYDISQRFLTKPRMQHQYDQYQL